MCQNEPLHEGAGRLLLRKGFTESAATSEIRPKIDAVSKKCLALVQEGKQLTVSSGAHDRVHVRVQQSIPRRGEPIRPASMTDADPSDLSLPLVAPELGL